MATKSAIDGPAGPVVAGDHLRRDSRSTLIDLRVAFFMFKRLRCALSIDRTQ